MNPFVYYMPTRLVFGAGKLAELATTPHFPWKRALLVVGLGGGSTIDSAKSIAVLAKNPGRYWDYMMSGTGGRKVPQNGALPIVAITTTAGTGTEADPWTVQGNHETREKIGWGGKAQRPAACGISSASERRNATMI
jgi:alcohol dehydrogenase class IV